MTAQPSIPQAEAEQQAHKRTTHNPRTWIPERVLDSAGNVRFQRQGDSEYWTDLLSGTQENTEHVHWYLAHADHVAVEGHWKGISCVLLTCHNGILLVDVFRNGDEMRTYKIYDWHKKSPQAIARRYRRAVALQAMLVALEFGGVDVWKS